MSEIYPVDDLEWENSSVGNLVRPDILKLPELDDDGCAELLFNLNDLDLDNQRPVAALIGLAPDAGSLWESLRVGELKTLLALAVGDADAIAEGCEWIRHFGQLDETRLRVYRCIESVMGLEEYESYLPTLQLLYGEQTVHLALDLLDGEARFFGLGALGSNFEASAMHQKLLAAYAKVQVCKTV